MSDALLKSIVESVKVAEGNIYTSYEDTILSHSTAIQHDSDVVHESFSRREEDPDDEDCPPARHYTDVLLLPPDLEPTHISHVPMNRFTIRPSSDYVEHVIKGRNYQDTLLLSQITPRDSIFSVPGDSSEDESDEDLEEMPRFRSRLDPCGPQAQRSARVIRSGTLSGDNIEILRSEHENNHGMDMLNELRDTVSKCCSLSDQATEITSGNSVFYETTWISVPKNTPSQNTPSQNTTSQNTTSQNTTSQNTPSASQSTSSQSTPSQNECDCREITNSELCDAANAEKEVEEEDPIYAQPDRPKSKKISRESCIQILNGCDVGDYMLRRNRENTILSIKVHNRIKHIKLEVEKESIKVGKEAFLSLHEMIEFYKHSQPVSMVHDPVYLAKEVTCSGLVK